jgi:predicted nucleic acid-binding protein
MNPSLLDTDSLFEVFKRRNQTVLANAATYLSQHQQFAFSAITRYEVRRGLINRRAAARLHRFAVFCQHSLVYPVNDDVLDQAALLRSDARSRGLPENDADLIITATALIHGRTLVTGNTAHYRWIPGLNLEDWRVRPMP